MRFSRRDVEIILIRLSLIIFICLIQGCLDSATSQPNGTGPVGSSGGSVGSTTTTFAGAITATNLNGTSVQLTWGAVPSAYTLVKIYYYQNGALSTPIATLSSSLTTYTVTGLTSDTYYSFVVSAATSGGTTDGNLNIVSALTYPGINSTNGATAIGTTTATINFPAPGGNGSGVNIYCANPIQAMILVSAVSNPSATSQSLTGLQSGTTYTCKVKAVLISTATEDNNTATYSFNTVSQTSTIYQGFAHIQAYGNAPNAPTATTAAAASPAITSPVTTPTAPTVNITWRSFNIAQPLTVGYRLVRVAHGGTLNMNVSTACTSSTATACQVCLSTIGTNPSSRTCQDTNISYPESAGAAVIYDYAVSLIVNSSSSPPFAENILPAGTSDTAYRAVVPIPPANMVLVQQDAANYEMCSLMGLTSDPLNHQRCTYSGLGAVPYNTYANDINTPLNLSLSYYDFGYNLFVDRFGGGCNWSAAAATTNQGFCNVGGTVATDCNGATNAAPSNALGVNGNVFYDYIGASCYVKQGGVWYNVNSGSLTTANLAASYTNAPSVTARVPPMVNVSQTTAWNVCQAQVNPIYGNERLLRRREQVAATAFQWIPESPSLLSSAQIASLQNGTSHPTTQACNSNTHNGVASPVGFNTAAELAGNNNGSAPGSFVLGADYTAQCVSRFGAQDLVGNVWVWESDQLASCSAGTHTCQGMNSSLDPGNKDLTFIESYNFDGVTGPGGSNTTEWNFSTVTFGATYFSAPMGLPFVNSDHSSALLIGTAITSSKLQTDHIWVYTDNGIVARGAFSGGAWSLGSSSGRFALFLNAAPTSTFNAGGFRCALPAQ